MYFTKMHGAGNDYVYVDGFNHKIPTNPQSLAVAISDRHTGVGADGLILILPSKNADAQMRMYNADGTESEMCGNGIRCVAKYLVDHGICSSSSLQIETGAGILGLDVFQQILGTVNIISFNVVGSDIMHMLKTDLNEFQKPC